MFGKSFVFNSAQFTVEFGALDDLPIAWPQRATRGRAHVPMVGPAATVRFR